MNASRRWAYHFVTNLECVRCRGRTQRKLYHFRGHEIVSETYTLDELADFVPHMDVWCVDCPPRVTMRVTGPGRLARKQEAARLARIATQGDWRSAYDQFVLDNGCTLSKHDLRDVLFARACMQCGGDYPLPVMRFYREGARAPRTNSTQPMSEFIADIEQSYVVCANCHELLTHGFSTIDGPPLTLDGNFFARSF